LNPRHPDPQSGTLTD